MSLTPQQFLIDIDELYTFAPKQPFDKNDIEIINFLHTHQRDPQEALLSLVDAVQKNDHDKVSKLSFYTKDTWQPLFSLASKVNHTNCSDLISLATYAFNDIVSIELNEQLEPINHDNVLKIQAAQLNCVQHVECTIIVPPTVSQEEVLLKFQTAGILKEEESDFSVGNIFQYYIKNTPLNLLIDETVIKDFKVETKPDNFLDVLDISQNDIDGTHHAMEKFIEFLRDDKNSKLIDFAKSVNPKFEHQDSNILIERLRFYFGSKLTLNKKVFSDFLNLTNNALNDEKIAKTFQKIISLYKFDLEDTFFQSSRFKESLSYKNFLNDIRNISKILTPKEEVFVSFINKQIKNDSDNELSFSTPRNTFSLHKISVYEQNTTDNAYIEYLENFIEKFDPTTVEPETVKFPLFVLFSFLKDEHRKHPQVIQAVNNAISELHPNNFSSNGTLIRNMKSINNYSNFLDVYLSSMSLETFQKHYLDIYKNSTGYPKYSLAMTMEIESTLQEVLKNNGSYVNRPFQHTKSWRDSIETLELSSILNLFNVKPEYSKNLPTLHQLFQSKTSNPFLFFFQKFCEEYRPRTEIIGHNSFHNLFGKHILKEFENDFEKLKISKENSILYIESFNLLKSEIKDKIIESLSNIDWKMSSPNEVELFQNLMSKLGKKIVLKMSQNPKLHPILKDEKNMTWLQTKSFFTNGAAENYKLPMQHMFTMKEVEDLYKKYPNREFVKISPFTFIPLAPMEYKSNPQLWVELINDKSKTSILQFMPLSLKNNPEVLLKMLKSAPNKTDPILSHFSKNAVQNISVFLQAIENIESNAAQRSPVLRIYKDFIESTLPGVTVQTIDFIQLRTLCEELLMDKIIPVNKNNKTKALKF